MCACVHAWINTNHDHTCIYLHEYVYVFLYVKVYVFHCGVGVGVASHFMVTETPRILRKFPYSTLLAYTRSIYKKQTNGEEPSRCTTRGFQTWIMKYSHIKYLILNYISAVYIIYNTWFLCVWHWLSRLMKAMIEGGLQVLCCVLYTPSKVMVVVTYYFWWSHQHDTHLKQFGEQENIHYCRFSLKSYILYAHCWLWFLIGYQPWRIISSPLFADADTGIYPQGASPYHARPKVKRGMAMPSVDEFPYPRRKTRGNKFIPSSNDVSKIMKHFRGFKIAAVQSICPKSSYKQSYLVTLLWQGKWAAAGVAIVMSSTTFLPLYTSRWWHQTRDSCPYITVVRKSETKIITEQGIRHIYQVRHNQHNV